MFSEKNLFSASNRNSIHRRVELVPFGSSLQWKVKSARRLLIGLLHSTEKRQSNGNAKW